MYKMATPKTLVATARDIDFTPSWSPDHETTSTQTSSGTASSGAQDSAAFPIVFAEAEAAKAEFLKGNRHNYYRPLYQAANRGDWESAERFTDTDSAALKARITRSAETVLHIAARACQWEFVLRLVEQLPAEELAIQDVKGKTALHYAAMGGNLRIAKALVRKNKDLPNITDRYKNAPIADSFKVNPCKDLVWYLILVTREEHFSSPDSPESGYPCYKLSKTGFHDITLYLLHRYPNLIFIEHPKNSNFNLLSMLLLTPSNFLSGSTLTFWQRRIYQVVHVKVKTRPPESIIADEYGSPGETESLASKVLQWLRTLLWRAMGSLKLVQCIRNVVELKSRHIYAVEVAKHVCELVSDMNFQQIEDFIEPSVLFDAVQLGVVEVLEVCIHHFPDLIFVKDRNGFTLFEKAILQRQERMFDFLMNQMPLCSRYSTGCIDGNRNTIMHIAAELPPSNIIASVPGAALQMQKELQWFKALEKLCTPNQKRSTNDDEITAMEVFTDDHKDLVKKGEKWMKDTSTSGMLVSTLIATVVFAGAFTVPGGNASNTGAPIFLRENSFVVFIISESLALFSSITSLLMFLSVLTARYTEDDFLFSLPNKIIIGLGTLFLAIVSMMAAFGSTLYIVLNERWRWVSFPIIVLAAFPVTLFVILQLPLFVQMINSTYGGGILGNKKLREFQNKLE